MTALLPTSALWRMAALFAVLIASCYTELRDNRIPNWVTIPGVLIGFLLTGAPGQIALRASVAGFCVGFLFLFVFYMYGGMGGGDVKLMGAVGALQGYPMILDTLMYTAIYGGLMAVLMALWRPGSWMRLLGKNESTADDQEKAAEKHGIPYGLAIIAGTLTSIAIYV